MTQINVSQKSFASGELSPELEVRSDVENYASGLSDSLNVLCTNKGELIPRPGTEFVSVTANNTADAAINSAKLIPFKYSQSESYILEFTEKRLRIHRNGKPLSFNPTLGNPTAVESISSAQYVHEMQYPVVGTPYGSESGQFVFPGENSFPYEAGAGPFRISDIQGNTIANLSYTHGSALNGTSERLVTNDKLFWVHSVERGVEGNASVNKRTSQNNVIGKPITIVRITWHPKFCEGGSAYDPDNFLIALNGTTQRPADAAFPASKWTFFTATIKAAVTTDDELLTVSNIDYQNHFGPTDTDAAGTATSPIPYLESDLKDIQYASIGDFMFLTHPDYQPLKIERVGLNSFTVRNHYTIGGPWRPYPTYPNTYWGGGYFMTGSATTVLVANDGSSDANGPTATNNDLRYRTNATDVFYLFKSNGTPDIITNSDLTQTSSEDSIVGRKIRIAINVGEQLSSNNEYPVTSAQLFTWNNNPTHYINTRETGYAGSGTSFTLSKPPRSIGSLISQDTTDTPTFFWFEGKVEALVNTIGSVKHKNPTTGYRIRITKGANFFRTTVDSRYLPPSARTKIGHLFEEYQPDQTGGWPRCVAVIDNRLVYASNKENPNALAFSSVGNFDDFTPDDYGYNVANDIDATSLANFSPASTYNPETYDYHSFVHLLQEGLADNIQWLKATNYGLIAGTENGIYLSPKLPSGQAYTPFNFTMRLVSEEGCNSVQAEYIDGKIYYVSKLGDKLLSMEYVNEADGFRPKVETILSEHLVKDGIKEIVYARTPISIIWLVTNSGSLVSGVRLDTNKEKAFFKHSIACADYNKRSQSLISSVAVIPSDDSSFDQLYLSVKRPRALTGVSASPSFQDPTSRDDIENKNINTLERLTQFSPYLKDSRNFVGLDCSISENTPYNGSQDDLTNYNENISILNAVNFNDNATPLNTDLKYVTEISHGISNGEKFMVNGFTGELSLLNLRTLHTANSSSGSTLFTTPLEESNLVDSSSSHSSGLFLGNPKLLKEKTAKLPGFFRESSSNRNLSFDYFPSINNFSFFRNGILDFSFFTLGEKGSSSQYSQFSSSNKSGFFSTVAAYDNNRVMYHREGTGYSLSGFYVDYNANTFSGSTQKIYSYNCGFKPNIYFTTLPPRMNNQLGSADLSFAFITSVSIQVIDTHQISVKNNESQLNLVNMIDDEYKTTELQPNSVVRRSGTYKQELVQPEQDTRGKVRFEPEPGYPFRILEINLRGERASRG